MTIYFKTVIAVIVFFFCMSIVADAQDFIVISCNGHVHHVMAGDSIPHKIRAGDKIRANGKLLLDKGASVKLICNERPQTFSEVEEVNLDDVFAEVSSQSISFTGRFWNFIVDGLKSSDSDKDLKEYHNEYLNVKGGIKGYSDNKAVISIKHPFGGIVTRTEMPVTWSSKNRDGLFTISVLDKSDRKVIYENKTKRRNHDILLSEIGLKRNDTQFYLRVSDDDCNFSEIDFQYSILDNETIERKLNSIIEYQSAEEKENFGCELLSWKCKVILSMQIIYLKV